MCHRCICFVTRYKDHYTWNKATTCVHNLLGGQRWVDHYGEVVIRNHGHGIKCKLTYAKVRVEKVILLLLSYDSNLFWNHSGRVLNAELYAQRLRKLIYLHLLTGYFMKISVQSSEQNLNIFVKQPVSKFRFCYCSS